MNPRPTACKTAALPLSYPCVVRRVYQSAGESQENLQLTIYNLGILRCPRFNEIERKAWLVCVRRSHPPRTRRGSVPKRPTWLSPRFSPWARRKAAPRIRGVHGKETIMPSANRVITHIPLLSKPMDAPLRSSRMSLGHKRGFAASFRQAK